MAENGQTQDTLALSKAVLEAQVNAGLQNIEYLVKRMPGLESIYEQEDFANIIIANLAVIHSQLKRLKSITLPQWFLPLASIVGMGLLADYSVKKTA